MAANDTRDSRLATATAALTALALWLVSRPYEGFNHDARLYALQALARLNPDSLGQDLFLKFGSQDAFTIFSPLYAGLIHVAGLEEAARLLALFGQAWWFAAAALLATRLVGVPRGFLAVALLAGLPGLYGAWGVFRYAEAFLTARLLSEAAVLSGLALLARERMLPAAGFMLAGLALHPLMGAVGCAVWLATRLEGRWDRVVYAGAFAATLLAVGIAVLLPHYPLSLFEPDWWDYVRQRSPFLSMRDWDADSWKAVLLPLSALSIFAAQWQRDPAAPLLGQVLRAGVLGLLITLLGATIVPVVLLTQGQGWRWTWLIPVFVAITAVRAVPALWAQSDAGRATLAFLASSWLLSGWPAVAMSLTAALSAFLGSKASRPIQRLLVLAALPAVLVSAYLWVTTGLLVKTAAAPDAPALLGIPLARFSLDGVFAALVAATLYWAACRPRLRLAAPALAGALCVAAAPLAVAAWTRSELAAWDSAALQQWRRIIPPHAELFWPENSSGSWLLLQRRSYVSAQQASGILFSPDAFREILRRVDEVSLVLPRPFAFKASLEGAQWPFTDEVARRLCSGAGPDYIVTSRSLNLPPAAVALTGPPTGDEAGPRYFLHRCADLAAPAASVVARPVA